MILPGVTGIGPGLTPVGAGRFEPEAVNDLAGAEVANVRRSLRVVHVSGPRQAAR